MTKIKLPGSARWAKSVRDDYGLTIGQWAPLMGVKPATIRRWERGGFIDPAHGKMIVAYEMARSHPPAKSRLLRIARMNGDVSNLMLSLLLETSDAK